MSRSATGQPQSSSGDHREIALQATILFAAALLALLFGLFVHRAFFHDDAYISLRYVERLLAGQGLTWNDGERVEGFSNPLWLAHLVPFGLLGVPLAPAAQILGVLYALASIALWYRVRADPLGLLALVTVPGWALWSLGGLETIGACFWLLAAMAIVWRRHDGTPARGLGLALAAVALCRPEGIAVSLALLGAAWLAHRGRDLWLVAATLAVLYLGYEAFRLAYFGDWLANAARAKAMDVPLQARLDGAATYLVKSAREWLGAGTVAACLIAGSSARRRALLLLLPCLPLLGLVVAGGGDHMYGARFMLAPIAVLCLAGSLAPRAQRGRRRAALLGLVVAAALWQLHLSWRNPAFRNPAAALGEIAGRTLEGRLPAGTLVAAATAGSLPYFAPSLSFIDTLGINDRHIARVVPAQMPRALSRPDSWFAVPGHMRGDGAYVLSRRPDVIMLGGAQGELDPSFLGDFQLVLAAGFRAGYAPWRLLVAVPPALEPWVGDYTDPASGRLPITLYVRRASRAWSVLARQAEPLRAPWAAAR